jgi:hypothetical protein
MELQEFKTDSKKFSLLLFGGATLFIVLFLLIFGFSFIFFLVLLLWFVAITLFFKFFLKFGFMYWFGLLAFMFVLSLGLFSWAFKSPTVHKNFGLGRQAVARAKLEECTSKPNAPLKTVAGMKGTLYGGKLDVVKGSPEPKDDAGIRTFSLKGLRAKTEQNSFYFEVRKVDGSGIKGYNDLIEICNEDNKGSSMYLTKNSSPNGVVKEDNVTARIAYFHGGESYILEPGKYRVDGYIRDLNGNWVLVAREEGITITE